MLGFTVVGGRIAQMNILIDPARLRRLDLTALAPLTSSRACPTGCRVEATANAAPS